MFVGFCRLSAVYFGFFDVWALRLAVYSRLKTSKFFSTPFAIKATYIMAIAIAFDVGEKLLSLPNVMQSVFILFKVASSG